MIHDAVEISLALSRQGLTSAQTLAKKAVNLSRLPHTSHQLQAHINAIIRQLDITRLHEPADSIKCKHCRSLPTHLHKPFLTLNHSQQSQFMQYISPLLSPLHALQEDVPRAYYAAVSLHQSSGQQEGDEILMIALSIAAIQDAAAKIILFLIPPLTSI